jgi:hypothetical protein
MISGIHIFLVIVWLINIWASLPRWVLEFAFHGGLCPEYEPFGKLNRSNWFRVCDWCHNYFPILYLKIRQGYILDRIWSESDCEISLEWGSRCPRHCTQTAHRLHTDCTQTAHRPHTDCTQTAHRLHTDRTQTAHRFQTHFDEHAYKLRTIQFWITEIWFSRQDLHDEIRTGWPPLDDFDAKILAILNKSLFESTRSIAKTFLVAHSIVLLLLHNSIDFRSLHLYWVAHLMTHDLREKRKEYAKAILPFLHVIERDGWHHLVTSDESWLFLNPSAHRMWILSRDDVVIKPRFDIQSKNSCLRSCGIWATFMLSTDSQMIPKWTATIL